MGKLRARLAEDTLTHVPLGKEHGLLQQHREYGLSDMNWKDTGDEVTDPSIEGYNLGYNIDPYQFHWVNVAKRNKLHTVQAGDTLRTLAAHYLGDAKRWRELAHLNRTYLAQHKVPRAGHVVIVGQLDNRVKTASDFTVTDYGYLPEQMAREFLTIWNGADSPIQDFFNGFVMNRFTNEMREALCATLNDWGYAVTPLYEDRNNRYASRDALRRDYVAYVKAAERAHREDDARPLLAQLRTLQPRSRTIAALHRDAVKRGRVTLAQTMSMLDYYKAIFPDDFADALINMSLDKGPFMGFKDFSDIQLTTQDMEKIDEFDSETAEPSADMVRGPNGLEYGQGSDTFTWDPITDLRTDTGFPASTYETIGRHERRKRLLRGVKKN